MPYKDKEKQKLATDIWHQKRSEAKKAYVEAVKAESGCIICGEPDPICLDFHHVGKKTGSVSVLTQNGSSLKRLTEELEKCVVLCCKCHRRLHAGVIQLP